MRPALLLPVCALLSACPGIEKPPGDENMGTYAFHAQNLLASCDLRDIPTSDVSFTGTVSRFRDGGGAYLTLNGVARDAGFDGQFVSSAYTARRTFFLLDGGSCSPCETRLVETLTFALLSSSQSAKVGNSCPLNPLDGGVPQPPGVTPPDSSSGSFDAVLACGELHEDILAIGNCDPQCAACRLSYLLTGERK